MGIHRGPHHNNLVVTVPEHRTRVITLTNRAPVLIYEADWPVIAKATNASPRGPASQLIWVRQHADGRVLVYGTGIKGKAGFLLGEKARPSVVGITIVVGEVARAIGAEQALIDACLAKLPPEAI